VKQIIRSQNTGNKKHLIFIDLLKTLCGPENSGKFLSNLPNSSARSLTDTLQ
jgi:hypothetical protein